MNISKQVALVTGANRGLGKHLAEELLKRGAKVYAGARNPESINIPGAIPIQLDITNPESVKAAASTASDVTLLINNAGTSTGASVLTGSWDDIHLEFDTHVFGTLSMVRDFAPVLEKNGGGAILNILSVLSWYTTDSTGAYSAAKSAEWSMTNALRLSLAPKNINVSGLHVGYMDTDMTKGLEKPKSDPKKIAEIAINGIENGLYEIIADDISTNVQKGLSGGVNALYPELLTIK
ncbi:SDR family oxidoreductase [Paenibacillus qinlingensis]|uniref:NAD(P)-dependent dehydrogenase (Short-subunit alcohol dehydrogenase family) n=1 Tax=Paenibacillus qinlingensis TaxID=1837343 RepID=A0ABU1NTJ8_9BACL|nr:SDR family oxidoreductase [Paenibacillus qinlingensis]MDR6550386.1 NAD(P)-dependent dehydrogenase (short-subunit alcohol dehydrogenase family) [Paenibacillus qinlingensis]